MDVYRKIPEHVLGRIAVAVSIYIGFSFRELQLFNLYRSAYSCVLYESSLQSQVAVDSSLPISSDPSSFF